MTDIEKRAYLHLCETFNHLNLERPYLKKYNTTINSIYIMLKLIKKQRDIIRVLETDFEILKGFVAKDELVIEDLKGENDDV